MILCYLLLPMTVIPVSFKLSWPLLPLRTGVLPTSISSFMQPTSTATFTIVLLIFPGLHDCSSSRYYPHLSVFPPPSTPPFVFSPHLWKTQQAGCAAWFRAVCAQTEQPAQMGIALGGECCMSCSFFGWYLGFHFRRVKENQYSWDFFLGI